MMELMLRSNWRLNQPRVVSEELHCPKESNRGTRLRRFIIQIYVTGCGDKEMMCSSLQQSGRTLGSTVVFGSVRSAPFSLLTLLPHFSPSEERINISVFLQYKRDNVHVIHLCLWRGVGLLHWARCLYTRRGAVFVFL